MIYRIRHRVGLFKAGVAALLCCGLLAYSAFRMPGRRIPDGSPTGGDEALETGLRKHVTRLASDIGERNFRRYDALKAAADYVEKELAASGAGVQRLSYQIEGRPFDNVIAEFPGSALPREIVVIGAHYDSVVGSPGANDNGTGVAAVLALARHFGPENARRTVRFAAFVNEEPFSFQSPQMGSYVYAQKCRERGETVVAMLSIETIGYFSDEPGSQKYPVRLLRAIYPDAGNFIAFVGNLSSRSLVRDVIGVFRKEARIPSEGVALPETVPGVGWSDHWSFWQAGYPAVMVTDTAMFRYPWYHTADDTVDKIDFDRMTRVVAGLKPVIRELAVRD